MVIYGIEFTKPTIQEFLSHLAAAAALTLHSSPESTMLKVFGNDMLAPLDPVAMSVEC